MTSIRYVQDKYGSDHVAQIVTYGTIKGRQSIRDAARVLGFPYMEGDRLTKMYPALIMGRDSGLGSALETSHEMREAYEAGGAAKEIIDTALKIENLKRSAGIHAAGVVIGRDPLVEHLPLKRGDHGEVVTQFDMNGVEELGLLKMDFLGLRNLTVIDLTRDCGEGEQGDRHRRRLAGSGGPEGLRDAPQGGFGRRVPARIRGDAQAPGATQARPFRADHGSDRAVPARTHGTDPLLHRA